ncbi:hypothetical protein OOJ96_15605 [Pseudomonas sp. 15FMM2]|uniref:Uncharacterized protein n=1 Tax=Pseudomonas imrae TaxID=2992837 RepID=A0ACC7PGV4_9PSED
MLSIGTNLPSRTTVPTLLEPKKPTNGSDLAETVAPSDTKAVEGVTVTFSGASLKAAGAEKAANNDIEESGLAENVQKLLKMIRQLKQQIAEKMAEMSAVMADKRLSPEQAQAKVAGLQSALGGLQAALATAYASLTEAMRDLSAEDALKAASLMAK